MRMCTSYILLFKSVHQKYTNSLYKPHKSRPCRYYTILCTSVFSVLQYTWHIEINNEIREISLIDCFELERNQHYT